jgi:hypothetical protein
LTRRPVVPVLTSPGSSATGTVLAELGDPDKLTVTIQASVS